MNFEKNDMIICNCENIRAHYGYNLTYNKQYKVENIEQGLIRVRNDRRRIKSYSPKLFIFRGTRFVTRMLTNEI